MSSVAPSQVLWRRPSPPALLGDGRACGGRLPMTSAAGLRQQIEVDVYRVRARRDDGAPAVFAHVGERHWLEAAH
jgi:hypothetical protein